MSVYWIWWIAAAALIAAELLTGTFYLLAVGVAVACGGVAAWLGWSAPYQWLTAGDEFEHRAVGDRSAR